MTNNENYDTSSEIWEMYKKIYKWSKYWEFENQKNNPPYVVMIQKR